VGELAAIAIPPSDDGYAADRWNDFLLHFNPVLGIANYLLGKIGVAPVPWLGEPFAARISILLISVCSGRLS
jgi:hypothetical protein